MSDDGSETTMTAKWISADRLQAILATYGAAAERWPDDERDAALALIARSDAARAMRDTAAGLDSALDSLQPPSPSDTLDARLRRLSPPGDPVAAAPRWRVSLGALLPDWRWAPIAAGAAGAIGAVLVGAALLLTVPAPDGLVSDGKMPTPVAAVDPLEAEDESPTLLAGVALVDPLLPESRQESQDGSGEFNDADLGIDSSAGFTGEGGSTVALGGLALE